MCANCGKAEEDGSIQLKSCVACKTVKYCNVECQSDRESRVTKPPLLISKILNQGYKSQFATCLSNGIEEGYPEWKFGNGKNQGGEMNYATLSGYINKKGKGAFDASLETGVPPLGGSCKIAQQ